LFGVVGFYMNPNCTCAGSSL